jgi:polar amino acid transport system permease protein
MTYKFDFGALLPYWQQLLYGCWLTIVLATLAIAIGLIIGIVTALAKQSRIGAINFIATSYVELIRNTPFLVQVFFIYFGLPALGVALQPWSAAGAALGLKPFQVFRYIVLKPAMRIVFPALSGQFILSLLTTSIVSSISAEELTSIAQSLDTLTFRSFEIYIVATLLYLSMSMIFATIFKAVDRIYFSYPLK